MEVLEVNLTKFFEEYGKSNLTVSDNQQDFSKTSDSNLYWTTNYDRLIEKL
jgi:hypothetical protein